MFGRNQRPESDAVEVIMGPRASFNGILRSDTSIRIDGVVDSGQIETPANVILTESARVTCDIVAKTVSIRGLYRGELRADRVELLRGSQVFGALHVNSFYMDEGVILHAEVNIQNPAKTEQVTLPRPEASASIPVIDPSDSSAR